MTLEFPAWIRITHFLNFLFLSLLVRSRLEVLSAHPKLLWGLGRHWHFASVNGWIITGLACVTLLFATGEWRRLAPTSWSIFPEAWKVVLDHAHLHFAGSSSAIWLPGNTIPVPIAPPTSG